MRCLRPLLILLAAPLLAAPGDYLKKCEPDKIDEIIEPPAPVPREDYWMVAVIQCNESMHPEVNASAARAEEIKSANRKDLEAKIRTAAQHGAKIIVTPEFGIVGYPANQDEWNCRKEIAAYPEKIPGPSTEYFRKIADPLDVFIQIGLPELGDDNLYYNAAVVLDPDGKIVAKHRKNNLYKECQFLEEGTDIAIYKTDVGNIGVAICADIYMNGDKPPLTRYHDKGVEILTVSSSWAACNSGWDAFLAAARNRFYFLGSNQKYCPDAGVINPNGPPQSHIRAKSEIAYGYLKLVKK